MRESYSLSKYDVRCQCTNETVYLSHYAECHNISKNREYQ